MRGYLAWSLILVAAGLWEAVGIYLPERGFVALGDILRFLLVPRGGRWVLFAAWLFLGWHFIVRYAPHVTGG